MQNTLFLRLLFLSWLCAALKLSAQPLLPPDIKMNRDAGCGDGIFVTIRLEDGESGQFLFDTGSSRTLLTKSFAPKLGQHLGKMSAASIFGSATGDLYPAPKLYLGDIPLSMSESNVLVIPAAMLQGAASHPVMGVLGLDCLTNYCIQLDFGTRTVRFLDSRKLDRERLGMRFPLIPRSDGRFNIPDNLVGVKGPESLLDTGVGSDGWLSPKLFELWKTGTNWAVHGGVHCPNGALGGNFYSNVNLIITPNDHSNDDQRNLIGLRFWARNLVTLDFPEKTVYLKQTSVGPLVDRDLEDAIKYLKALRLKSELPGWPKGKHGTALFPDVYSNRVIFTIPSPTDSSTYHYIIERSGGDAWTLRSAWRTSKDGQVIEKYRIQ